MPMLFLGIDARGMKSGAAQAETSLSSVSKATDRTIDKFSQLDSAISSATKRVLALVGAYKTIGAMKNFVQRGIEFNSSIESSRIGIASLITSMVRLEDAQGNALEGAQKYAAAQGIAADLMKEIQRLGLETTATTQELVEGVQSIMGPALQAGMALKDIPQFAVAGAQALQTLGVPLDQMRTELEALLSGNINKAQDILAPKLFADVQGDLGEYIRGLRESGKLIGEINKRLEPFMLAGKDVAQTWKGLTSNLSEALDVLAGQTGAGLTDSLKKSLLELQGVILSTENGTVGISDDFQNIAKLISDIESKIGGAILTGTQALAGLVKNINSSLKDFDFDDNFELIANGIKAVALAYGSMRISRSLASKAQGEGIVADMRAQGVLQALTAKVVSYDSALQKKIVTDKAAAQAELEAANTALTRLEREKVLLLVQEKRVDKIAARLVGTQNEARAEQLLANSRNRLIQIDNQLAAAESRVAVATAKVAATAKGATLATAAISGLGTAVSGLVSLFGGPAGLAFTAATTVIGLLATRQTQAEKAAELHSKALVKLQAIMEETAQKGEKLGDGIGEGLKSRLQDNIETLEKSLEHSTNAINVAINRVRVWAEFEGFSEQMGALDKTWQKVKEGTASFNDLDNAVGRFRNELNETGNGASKTGKFLRAALDLTEEAAQTQQDLRKVQGEWGKIKEIMEGVEVVAEEIVKKTAAAFDAKKLQGIFEALDLKKLYAGLDGLKLAQAQALQQAGKTAEEIKLILSGAAESADSQKLLKAVEETYQAERNKKIQEEASRKREQATKQAIADAKSAAQAVRDLETQTNRLAMTDEEFREWELTNRTIPDLMEKTAGATELVQEYAQKTREAWAAEDAKQAQEERKNQLSLEAQLLKDLAEFTGNYNLSIESQNALLEQQAQIFREGLNPELTGAINEWLRLQKIQNSREAWAGAYRATQQYFSEATNLAQGFEGLTTNAFSSMEDAIVEFASTGKLSFSDMVNSMISDLIRLTVRANITGPLAGALGSGLTSLFDLGGGTATASVTGNSISSGWANAFVNRKFATGGAFFGGNLSSYRNSIVSSPTFFTHDRHISRYAKGAGLMGEAGPEAIMPLVRMSGGDLGVRADVSSGSVVNNITITPPAGYEAQESRAPNNQGGENVQITFIRSVVSGDMNTYGSQINRAMRSQGTRMPVMRGGG